MTDEPDGTGDHPTTPKDKLYEVGFGKPPKHSQFKPGQSGNPKGPPKKRPSSRQLLLDALDREIAVTVDGRKRIMTMHEALIASSVDKAMKGTLKEKLALLRMVGQLEEDPAPGGVEGIISEQGLLKVRVNIGKPPGLLDGDD